MKNDFRAFGFNVVCLHLLSVSSSAAIGPLSVNHAPQFLSSNRHIHTQTANKTPLCLHCRAGRLFTKSCTLWLYRKSHVVANYFPHIGMGVGFIWIHLNECKQEESSLKELYIL